MAQYTILGPSNENVAVISIDKVANTITSATTALADSNALFNQWGAEIGGGTIATDGTSDDFANVITTQHAARLGVYALQKLLMYSSEAGYGVYVTNPASTVSGGISLPNTSRMYVTNNRPTILFTYHPANEDLEYNGLKHLVTANGIVTWAQHNHYGGSSSSRFFVVTKWTAGELRFAFFRYEGQSMVIPFVLWSFDKASTTSSTTYNNSTIASLFSGGAYEEYSVKLNQSYQTNGKWYSAPQDLSAATNVDHGIIKWTGSFPAGTTLDVLTAITNDSNRPDDSVYTACTNGGSISGISSGDDLTGKFLHVRIDMTTADNSISPEITSLRALIASPNDHTALLIQVAKSFCNAIETTHLQYDSSKGLLHGPGGYVNSFSVDFIATGLIPKPDIGTVETVASKINNGYINMFLTNIDYKSSDLGGTGTAKVNVISGFAVTLTPIGSVTP